MAKYKNWVEQALSTWGEKSYCQNCGQLSLDRSENSSHSKWVPWNYDQQVIFNQFALLRTNFEASFPAIYWERKVFMAAKSVCWPILQLQHIAHYHRPKFSSFSRWKQFFIRQPSSLLHIAPITNSMHKVLSTAALFAAPLCSSLRWQFCNQVRNFCNQVRN